MKKWFALLFLTALGLRGEIEFSGFFLTSKESLFSLTDPESKQSSGWLRIGQSFGGYTVVAFDHAREVITLKRAEQSREVSLRPSKVKDGKATISGTVTLLNEQVEGVKASLFLGEEAVFPLKDGVTLRMTSERRADGNMLYRSRFDVRRADGTDEAIECPSVVARPGTSFGVRMGDYGYTFKP